MDGDEWDLILYISTGVLFVEGEDKVRTLSCTEENPKNKPRYKFSEYKRDRYV